MCLFALGGEDVLNQYCKEWGVLWKKQKLCFWQMEEKLF